MHGEEKKNQPQRTRREEKRRDWMALPGQGTPIRLLIEFMQARVKKAQQLSSSSLRELRVLRGKKS